FATGSDRVAHRSELNAVVAERCARSDADRILAELQAVGIACAGVNDVSAFLDHPVLAGRDRWREVAVPGGAAVEALLPPADLAGTDPRMDPVPAVGEHTDAILAELGRSAADIAALRADGVV
ncbi:MAG TPA: CoA transferase, partial [Streptomyces sp.]|nr:CoA transferase [Streptomyces sp.]